MSDFSSFQSVAVFALGLGCGMGAAWLFLKGRGQAHAQMADTFKALAADTLHANSAAFLQLAEGKLHQREQTAIAQLDKKTVAIDAMVKPVSDTLAKVNAQLQALEVKREGAYRELAEMVNASRETQMQLRNETSQLLQALRAPTARGRWGEIQLQRILEMTGMSVHAKDFSTQTTFTNDDGRVRPDVIVSLPGNHCVIIDSKVPLTAYLDSVQTSDDSARIEAMRQHARQLKDHIKTLASKAYWEKIDGTPEFVVLFLPGEHFLSAALDGDNTLMDYSAQNQVVLATPMTLIALLRAVAYGWRQEALADNAQHIAELGGKLLDSLGSFSNHLGDVGSKLSGAVDSYNKAVGSMERNVLVKARRLAACGAGAEGAEDALAAPSPIEREPRLVMIEGGDRTAKRGPAEGPPSSL